uniref:Uncharacterized protein n=1 Tax=Poecilia latipinna TaxID=48699 RepID=A0A3B3U870_9TELE
MAPGVHRLVKSAWLPLLSVLLLSEARSVRWTPGDYADTASDALRFLSDYNITAEEVFFNITSASWNYNTNLTELNSRLQVEHAASLVYQNFSEAWGMKAKQIFSEEVLKSLSEKDRRLFAGVKFLGSANLPQAERVEVQYSRKFWPSPEAIRNYSLLGRAGTMYRVCLLKSTIPGLWSSVTKPLKGMVRTMGLK